MSKCISCKKNDAVEAPAFIFDGLCKECKAKWYAPETITYQLEQTVCPYCQNTEGNLILSYEEVLTNRACGKCHKHYVMSRSQEELIHSK